MYKLIFMALFSFSCVSFAGISEDMSDFYNKFGATSNFTAGGAYYGQMGGSFTGGSAYIRSPVKSLKLLNLQMPSISSGCQGIDIFTGGMGFANSEQVVQQMKAIAANAQGYMFSLMMNQISPQINAEIKEWLAMVNEHNFNNINSCQMAMQAVDNGINLIHSSMKSSCINKRLKDNGGTRTEAMRYCQTPSHASQEVKAAAKDPETKEEAIASNVNITWYAINKNPVLKDLEIETKYLLMSLIGTVVLEADNDTPKQNLYPSKLDDAMLEALNSDKEVKVYTCSSGDTSDSGCLKVTEKSLKLSKEKSFISQVKVQLQEIERGISEDTEPSVSEKNKLITFLDSTVIPVYHILNVYANTTFSNNSAPVEVSEYSNLIAMDILYKFIGQGIDDVMQSISGTMLPEKTKYDLVRMVSQASKKVKSLQREQIRKIRTTNNIILRVQMLERQIKSNASISLLGNLNFRKSMLL